MVWKVREGMGREGVLEGIGEGMGGEGVLDGWMYLAQKLHQESRF